MPDQLAVEVLEIEGPGHAGPLVYQARLQQPLHQIPAATSEAELLVLSRHLRLIVLLVHRARLEQLLARYLHAPLRL